MVDRYRVCLTRGLNGSEPLDLDPTARERRAARAAAGGAGGEVGFVRGLDGKMARDAGVPIGVLRRDEDSRGRRPAARGGAARRGSLREHGEGRGGERNRRRASLPPRESSGALGCRRGAARRRRGKLPSQAATAAAAWRIGHGGGGLSRGAAECLDVRSRGGTRRGEDLAGEPDSNPSPGRARGRGRPTGGACEIERGWGWSEEERARQWAGGEAGGPGARGGEEKRGKGGPRAGKWAGGWRAARRGEKRRERRGAVGRL
jgi:hypothetical protein